MAVRYTIPIRNYDNASWRIDISDNSATATAITLRSIAKSFCEISHDGETDDPFAVFIKSTLTTTVYNQDNIDINELQNAQDKDFKVTLYKNSTLKWTGYLKTEGIQRRLQSNPTTVQLEAMDGLSMLADIDYTHQDLPGGRSPINYFRQILFADANLGLALPIRWTNNLRCTAYLSEDVFAGSVRWSTDDQGFYSYQASQSNGETGKVKKCGEILEEMLRSMQCRIVQDGGMWKIRRINDLAAGSVNYKQIAGTLGVMTIQSGTENLVKQIGRTGYKFQNKDAVITTKQGLKSITVQYEANVRENILPNGNLDILGDDELPIYWGFYNDDPDTAYAESEDSLDGRPGKSVYLYNGPTANEWYGLKVPLATLGDDGLPIDSQTLVKQLNFSFLFLPISGFNPDGDGVVNWDGGPLKIMVNFNLDGTKFYLSEYGFWTETPTEINIVIPGLKVNEIAKVAFDKFQGIIMPTDNTQPEPGYISEITIAFRVRTLIRYGIDNVTFSIDQANDVYESIYSASKNTSTDTKSLKISSSYGGYMISNFMSSWDKSGDECYFADGLFYQGTLTGLTANSMMRFRYKSSKIFNGTINVRNLNYSFDQIYQIDTFGTEKYLPLNARYNIETCEVFLVAMECRNDAIELTEKYYSSNDKILSN